MGKWLIIYSSDVFVIVFYKSLPNDLNVIEFCVRHCCFYIALPLFKRASNSFVILVKAMLCAYCIGQGDAMCVLYWSIYDNRGVIK